MRYLKSLIDIKKFLNININAGEYAWKPAIINEVANQYKGIIIWCDAGDIFYNVDTLIYVVKNNYLYTPTSSGSINERTDIRTLNILSKKYDININFNSRNAACIGFNTNIDWIQNFLKEWLEYSLNKDCIAPLNHNRSIHRWDQSILTVLYYHYLYIYKFTMIDYYIEFDIHKDID